MQDTKHGNRNARDLKTKVFLLCVLMVAVRKNQIQFLIHPFLKVMNHPASLVHFSIEIPREDLIKTGSKARNVKYSKLGNGGYHEKFRYMFLKKKRIEIFKFIRFRRSGLWEFSILVRSIYFVPGFWVPNAWDPNTSLQNFYRKWSIMMLLKHYLEKKHCLFIRSVG